VPRVPARLRPQAAAPRPPASYPARVPRRRLAPVVRGPRYGWLAHEIVDAQLPLLVADIGLALAAFHLERGRAPKAAEALERALVSTGTDERLWNELLRAVHATGDEARLRALAAEFARRSGARGLPPRTAALLDELLPGAAASGEAGTA